MRLSKRRQHRGVEYDTINPVKKLKLMLPLCAPLLISSAGKTDATALAAEQRGFYLRTRKSSYKRYPFAALRHRSPRLPRRPYRCRSGSLVFVPRRADVLPLLPCNRKVCDKESIWHAAKNKRSR